MPQLRPEHAKEFKPCITDNWSVLNWKWRMIEEAAWRITEIIHLQEWSEQAEVQH